jgi:protein-disulfide isomerase
MTNARAARTTREKAAELRAEAARREARRRTILIITSVVAALVVLVGAGIVVQMARQESERAAGTTPPANLRNGAFVVGKDTAPVTLTIYSDYLCPFCKVQHDNNLAQTEAWIAEGTAKVEYRMVAFLDQASTDEYSSRALNAAAAVLNSAPDAFPKFHNALYAEQPAEGGPGLSDDRLVELAVEAGAPKDPVQQAVTKRSYWGWTASVTEQASKDGVSGTPTVLVNGSQVENPTDAAAMKAAVEKALDKG